MPLKLVPPSEARRTPFYSVRGNHLGVRVDRSTKTDRAKLAAQLLRRWIRQIERGEYVDPKAARAERRARAQAAADAQPVAKTFSHAALAYLRAGGEGRFLGKPLALLGRKNLASIDQETIDAAAAIAYPRHPAATRNRQFYTPVSAVMKHVGIERDVNRPKGWRGNQVTRFLQPEQAFKAFKAADRDDREFGVFVRVLCYTGMRLSEATAIRIRDVDLKRATIHIPETKNQQERFVYLPPEIVTLLRSSQRANPRGRSAKTRTLAKIMAGQPDRKLFRFHKSGLLYERLHRALAAAGVHFPPRQKGFHLFCHTYGTWQRRYGGLDTNDLTKTGRWKDPASAARYEHTELTKEARRAGLFPVERSRRR